MNFIYVKINELKAYENNPRRVSDSAVEAVANSIKEFGFKVPCVVTSDNVIITGHTRVQAAQKLGLKEVPCIVADDLTPEQIKAFRIIDNKTSELSTWDFEKLQIELEGLSLNFDMDLWGFEFPDKTDNSDKSNSLDVSKAKKTLAERFFIPPFSIFDTRKAEWQNRKKAWINIGLSSEQGRDKKLLFQAETATDLNFYKKKKSKEKELGREITTAEFIEKYYVPDETGVNSGTSIFDPVLCELIYRWFSKDGDVILDPFAGGAVRGTVASLLKRKYYGIDLRQEQIDANVEQLSICNDPFPIWITGNSLNINELTNNVEADLILSCPPYVDLEKYSDSPEDLSNMSYSDFLNDYRHIIKKTCSQLKEDRFACFVIGEVRDNKGDYYGFVPDTIQAFKDAGLKFYNEAILLNAVGNAAVRAGKQFVASRKLCKIHQNVLVFLKGNAKRASSRLGECEFGDLKEDIESEEPVFPLELEN